MNKDNKYNLDNDSRSSIDTDGDGLSDYEEVNIYGTDPFDPDTDKDGMSDGDEVKAGRNPKGPGMLQDLFLPNPGNNYKPRALHPWRLAFHALTAVLLKVFVVVMVLVFPIEAWLTPDIQIQESKKIITLTNQVRQGVGLSALSENSLLTRSAFQKAEDMLLRQYFAHTGPDGKKLAGWLKTVGYNYATAGENLAMGFANSEDVVNGWTRSATHYANMVDPDFTEIGVGMASGAYKDSDTTFVAQHFGLPNVFLAVADSATPEPEPESVPSAPAPVEPAEPESSVPSPKPESSVLSEKPKADQPKVNQAPETEIETKELVAPRIVFPTDNFLSNKNEIEFHFFAPDADKVVLRNNEKAILKLDGTPDGQIVFSGELEEGSHILSLVSLRGDQSAFSESVIVVIDQTPPMLDEEKSRLIVSQAGEQKSLVVRAEVILSADTEKAEVNFNNYRIILSPEEDNKWTGHVMIFSEDKKEIFNPVVLANVTAVDFAGNKTMQDINWENIVPTQPSVLSQYFFVKSNQSQYLKPIFSLSSWYFKLILVLLSISLILSIFIEIKKQHPRIIISSIGLIGLLFILIIL